MTTVAGVHHAKFWRNWSKNWGGDLSPLALY